MSDQYTHLRERFINSVWQDFLSEAHPLLDGVYLEGVESSDRDSFQTGIDRPIDQDDSGHTRLTGKFMVDWRAKWLRRVQEAEVAILAVETGEGAADFSELLRADLSQLVLNMQRYTDLLIKYCLIPGEQIVDPQQEQKAARQARLAAYTAQYGG